MRLSSFLQLSILLYSGLFNSFTLGCTSEWVPFSSLPYQEGAFPETHVTYFRYSFQIPKDKPVKIRIRGIIPKSRYLTFNLYAEATRSSIGSLPDTQLMIDGLKTYRAPREGESYTLWLTSRWDETLSNQLLLTPNPERNYEIWYRVYLPENGPLGGVDLPQIETFEEDGKLVPSCLKSLIPLSAKPMVISDMTKLPPRPSEEGDISFYSSKGLGLYNNGDNQYLMARLDFSKERLFALLKFKAPTFGTNSQSEVRYFSFCIGSARTTTTSGCIADKDMKAKDKDLTYLLIGPEELDGINFKRLAEAKGVNFLSKGKNFIPVVIYRYVLPQASFTGKFNEQYSWPPEMTEMTKEEAAERLAQHRLIGEYAPTGQHMRSQDIWNWLNQIP